MANAKSQEDPESIITVRAVARGWYGLTPDEHKLFDPEKMKPEQLVFRCRLKDFINSDVKRDPFVPQQLRNGKMVKGHRGPGWMERLDTPAPAPKEKAEAL